MSGYLGKVSKFMLLFNQPQPLTPCIPPSDRVDLRLRLLKEELSELVEAIEEGDLVGVLDGFIDIQYVLSGAIQEFGMGDIFDKNFDLIHENNMSKGIPEDRVLENVRYYEDQGIEVVAQPTEIPKVFRVMRKSDMKVLKSKDHEPPRLEI